MHQRVCRDTFDRQNGRYKNLAKYGFVVTNFARICSCAQLSEPARLFRRVKLHRYFDGMSTGRVGDDCTCDRLAIEGDGLDAFL